MLVFKIMSGTHIHFWGSVIVLGGLLFFPVSKMIWVFSVRRLQRKLNKELSEQETSGQLARARFICHYCSISLFLFFQCERDPITI